MHWEGPMENMQYDHVIGDYTEKYKLQIRLGQH